MIKAPMAGQRGDTHGKPHPFLKLLDFTPAEIQQFLDTAADLKAKKKAGIPHRYLEGKNVALIFEKPPPGPGVPLRWPART